MDDQDWRRYLADFHGSHPGITERLLGRADASPYAWLCEPLASVAGPVVDVACGSAPTRDTLADRHWVGADSSPAELGSAAAAARGPLVAADASALPFAADSAGAVCAAMSLQVVTPLADVLAEVRRVLRPGGVVASLTPARIGVSPRTLPRWTRLLGAAGVGLPEWPNPEACDGAADVLRAHGFTVLASHRRVFRLHLATPEDAESLVESLYLPHGRARRRGAGAAPGFRRPVLLPLPLRRVVARLPE